MIAQLHGTLLEATPSLAVLDVSGIGFEMGISGTTAAALSPLGEDVRLYTRMRVGNDAVALFGFATIEERAMFDRLVSVSSVGPRLALAVLSKYTPSQVYSIVMAEDIAGMSAVSGVGKKTAQRLILELKGSLAKDRSFTAADAPAMAPLPLARPASSPLEDAKAALLSMGFSPQETDLALDGYDGEDMRVEELLAAALKRLGMDA